MIMKLIVSLNVASGSGLSYLNLDCEWLVRRRLLHYGLNYSTQEAAFSSLLRMLLLLDISTEFRVICNTETQKILTRS